MCPAKIVYIDWPQASLRETDEMDDANKGIQMTCDYACGSIKSVLGSKSDN